MDDTKDFEPLARRTHIAVLALEVLASREELSGSLKDVRMVPEDGEIIFVMQEEESIKKAKSLLSMLDRVSFATPDMADYCNSLSLRKVQARYDMSDFLRSSLSAYFPADEISKILVAPLSRSIAISVHANSNTYEALIEIFEEAKLAEFEVHLMRKSSES